MFKKVLLFSLLLIPSLGLAQSTTVTATVTDSDSQVWAGGTWKANLVLNPYYPGISNYTWTGGALTQQFSGTLNSSGALSQSLPDNATITPGGTQWLFTFCSATSNAYCYTKQLTITGGSQNISASLTPQGPRFDCRVSCYGYSTTEAQGMTYGSLFYNSTTNLCSQYTGAAWGDCAVGVVQKVPPALNPMSGTVLATYPGLPVASAYRLCTYMSVVTAASGGTNIYIYASYTQDGHAQTRIPAVLSTITTPFTEAQGCSMLYADANTTITITGTNTSMTGSPSFRIWATLERME